MDNTRQGGWDLLATGSTKIAGIGLLQVPVPRTSSFQARFQGRRVSCGGNDRQKCMQGAYLIRPSSSPVNRSACIADGHPSNCYGNQAEHLQCQVTCGALLSTAYAVPDLYRTPPIVWGCKLCPRWEVYSRVDSFFYLQSRLMHGFLCH